MLQEFFIKVPRHRKTINKLYVSLRVFFKMSLTHKNPLLLASRRPPPPPPLLISGPSTSSPPSELPVAPPPHRTAPHRAAPMRDRRWCSPAWILPSSLSRISMVALAVRGKLKEIDRRRRWHSPARPHGVDEARRETGSVPRYREAGLYSTWKLGSSGPINPTQ